MLTYFKPGSYISNYLVKSCTQKQTANILKEPIKFLHFILKITLFLIFKWYFFSLSFFVLQFGCMLVEKGYIRLSSCHSITFVHKLKVPDTVVPEKVLLVFWFVTCDFGNKHKKLTILDIIWHINLKVTFLFHWDW